MQKFFALDMIEHMHQTRPMRRISVKSGMSTMCLTFSKSVTVLVSVSKMGAILHQA